MSLDGKKLSVMNELDPDQQGICSATLSFFPWRSAWPIPPLGCGRDIARLSHPVEASGHGLKSGRIKRMVINHFSFLSPTPTPLAARPQRKALWPSKAIPSTCCLKTSWPTINLTFIGVLRFRTRCAGNLALFVSCTDSGRLLTFPHYWNLRVHTLLLTARALLLAPLLLHQALEHFALLWRQLLHGLVDRLLLLR